MRFSQQRRKNVRLSERPTVQNEPDPFRDAQMIDIDTAQRAWRLADISRRRETFLALLLLLSLLCNAIQATKDHTSALVYREDGKNGTVEMMGFAGSMTTPTLYTVENQLASWITYVRSVPGDATYAQQNQNRAMLMVAKSSDAETQLQRDFANNGPVVLSKELIRTVSKPAVNRLTDLTYQILWSETSTNHHGDGIARATYQGTVTLKTLPTYISDPLLGLYNPAGIFISAYDLKV